MTTATEPLFLDSRRQQARELAAALALPAKTDEAWRRTSLEGLDLDAYNPGIVKVTLKGDVPEGVIFTDMLTAASKHADLVGKYLGTQFDMGQNKLTAAQAAHLNGGLFLYVPRNVVVTEPLQVVYEGAEGEAQYLHTLVVAEENSQVTILERYEGTGEYLSIAVVEVFPGANAKVRYGYLQNHAEDAWAFLFRRGKTGRDSTLEWVGGEFGGGLVRSELVTDVNGVGSESTIKVVYGATANQHIDLVASEVHTGDNSRSDILGRGVLSGKAHTVFRGNGQIKYQARNCSTYQRQQALVLSPTCRADAIPALIIDENEVAGAGHAATVGKLDEEQLFYLMARGLSRKQAISMLVMAFLSPVLDQIPVEELRTEMTSLMGEKVNG
ncbi:MAG TPA: Fe-S cluster assembly protein SufD [Symbiobacteriaceae bacterium]|nr:Fe-S cluster assembly protein SufD [Symbiobacteriaceae bacterium]